MPERRLLRRARRVLEKNRGATDRLLGGRAAFSAGRRQDGFFLRAMNEAFAHHFLGCPAYRERCLQVGVTPGDVRTVDDLPRIPWLPLIAFQQETPCTGDPGRTRLTLDCRDRTLPMDARTLRRTRQVLHNVCRDLKLAGRHRTDCLCLAPDPREAGNLDSAFQAGRLTRLARVGEVFWALRPGGGGEWALDREGSYLALERFEARGRPFRLVGPAALARDLVGGFERDRGRALSFPPRSSVLSTDGWRSPEDRGAFRRDMARLLGLPVHAVRDLYCRPEHGVPYLECEAGRMHVPIYSRVCVRDPRTMDLLPAGEAGVFQLLSPCVSSYPALSLLTTESGRLERGCLCGRPAPTLALGGANPRELAPAISDHLEVAES